MKTKECREFLRSLSALTNSFTHYLFIWTQFDIDHAKSITFNPEVETSVHFRTNPLALRHNVRLRKLQLEHDKTLKTLTEGVYVLLFSYYESYLKGVYSFAQQCKPTIPNLTPKSENNKEDKSLLHKVLNQLGIDETAIPFAHLETMRYLRLKRNRLTHRNSESISGSLNDVIRESGASLNQFWVDLIGENNLSIDFSSKIHADELSFEILINSINILRKVVEEFDRVVINGLGIPAILEAVITKEFKAKNRDINPNISDDRLWKKFEYFCECEYSLFFDKSLKNEFYGSIVQR